MNTRSWFLLSVVFVILGILWVAVANLGAAISTFVCAVLCWNGITLDRERSER